LYKSGLQKALTQRVNLSITFTFNYLQVVGDCQTTTKYVEAEILAGNFAGEKITAVRDLDECIALWVLKTRNVRKTAQFRGWKCLSCPGKLLVGHPDAI
jgi:hypothetical protein